MQGNNKGITTPVVSTPTPASTRCLLPASTLLDALTQAKKEREIKGEANAYAVLLVEFHKAILPAFFVETKGNLSEVARLTGIHRQTIRTYCKDANISMAGKVGAA